MFQGLWCMADKLGRLEDRPKHLKVMIMPYDKTDMDKTLCILSTGDKPFIIRYQVDNKGYIQIVNFLKHQKPHHTEKDSIIPEYKSGIDKIMGKGMGSVHEASTGLDNGSKTVKPPLKDILPIEFVQFWTAYPYKIGKDKALEAWKKKKPPLKRCLKTLSWQVTSEQWKKENGQYIPMPTTWLNQGRWTDIQPGYDEFTCDCGNIGQIKKGYNGPIDCGECHKRIKE